MQGGERAEAEMDGRERAEARAGILEELRGLFAAAFAWETWGRLLVHVDVVEDGRPVVVDVAVEDIVGDEARLAAAFEGPEVRASLPAVARAVEALVAIDALELEALGGGTFVRTSDDQVAFLPGLVRSPSATFDRSRDEVVARGRARDASLAARFGLGADARLVPSPGGRARVRREDRDVAVGEAVVLGTFSRPRRSFVWAATNPSLPEDERRACSALLDAMPQRDSWEIATFGFATDEPTAAALCAWVCDTLGGDGVVRVDGDGGPIFVLVRALRAVDAEERP